MKKRILVLLIGVAATSLGFSGLLSGELTGFGATISAPRSITYESDPIEFVLMLLSLLGGGGWCLWAYFFEK